MYRLFSYVDKRKNVKYVLKYNIYDWEGFNLASKVITSENVPADKVRTLNILQSEEVNEI
jgi:hypothetical protein